MRKIVQLHQYWALLVITLDLRLIAIVRCIVAGTDCRPPRIPCPGGSGRCIQEYSLCDGYDHCGDNSDEDPANCQASGQLHKLITPRALYTQILPH